MEIFDCIVVGGGIIGLYAAYDLAKKTKNVLVIDQFTLPHTRGSSHGPIRLLRSPHSNPVFARMAFDSLSLWEELEKQSKTTLLRKTGGLLVDKAPFAHLEACVTSAKQLGIAYRVLSSDDIREKYPGLITVPDECRACYLENSRTVEADKALKCLRESITEFGGKIRDEEKVVHITPGKIITVTTNKGIYRTAGLVLAPGSWASEILKPFGVHPPVRVKRATVCYWKEPKPRQTANYPVFVDTSFRLPSGDMETEPFFGYGFPSSEYPGLRKIGVHHGPEVNPNTRDATPENDMKIIYKYVHSRFPEFGVDVKPSIIEPCMYTDSIDGKMIVDSVSTHDNIIYCCGLSGSGFKAAPMVGRVLAESVLGETTSYDLSSFRLSRFPRHLLQSKY